MSEPADAHGAACSERARVRAARRSLGGHDARRLLTTDKLRNELLKELSPLGPAEARELETCREEVRQIVPVRWLDALHALSDRGRVAQPDRDGSACA